ncbi:Paxillin, putative [Pediculus humanus corporis]|uniref:Paxillin, putative n=1 Tax=Pediculus humanus subsp. corporis TaxID=121224 RepID=E0VTT4_PEDHC|nr:Paxillin, putative [Pediculus humanus corporis]EEB16790.1 Paxillin, putative [Pediculus humanus corporis]
MNEQEFETIFGDALLADLQNTISPSCTPIRDIGSSTSGYGSLNGPRKDIGNDVGTMVNQIYTEKTTSVQKTHSPPTHQQQNVGLGSPKSPVSPKSNSSFNNNLSELDTLLQDLSNAKYANTGSLEKKKVNGSSSPVKTTNPVRPTVDSLLDELSSPLSNGTTGDLRDVYVRKTYTVTENQTESRIPISRNGGGGGHTSPISVVSSTGPLPIGTSASSATKELDDLMASLSDFKINEGSHQHQTVTDSPYAKPNKATKTTTKSLTQSQFKQNQLDSMLGNLQADMSRQGINTAQKGCCNACDKPIVGQVITALGKTWHPEHFTCTHCNQELGTRNFFERDGVPYCESDYHNLFSPRCAYCNGPILDKCVTALEKTWHTEHFFCAQCGKQFGEEGFHEREGKPYCREDYFDMFAPKCGGCNRPIMENYISALNSQWHTDCFVCRDCRQPFQGGSFFDHEGLPYCETHYHAKRGSLCAGCHKPITGRCITAMFRKFHPEHFVCAFCLKQLNKGTFKEQNDKPYCHGCFDKLFG